MPTEGLTVSGTLKKGKTEKQRTLWRTHSVVCRRCKAFTPNLSGKRTEMQWAFCLCICYAVLTWGLFLFLAKKGNYYARKNYGFHWIHFCF